VSFSAPPGAFVELQPGESKTAALQAPPPGVVAECGAQPDKPGTGTAKVLRVEDPHRYWIGDGLACNAPGAVAGIVGPRGGVLRVARKLVHHEQPGDQFQVAGYPGGLPREVRVRRNGNNIALLEFHRYRSHWKLQVGFTCPRSGLGFS